MLSGFTETSRPSKHSSAETADPGTADSGTADHGARDSAREFVASVTQAGSGDGVIQVVRGARRVGWAAYRLQRDASETVRGVVKPPYAATESLDSLECLKLSEGVDYQVLYDRAALARPPQLEVTSRLVSLGEQARIVHLAPTKLLLVDNAVALLPLTTTSRTVESAVVVRSSAMLAALVRIFDDLWRFAGPFTSHGVVSSETPSEEERWILSLLASGSTDENIGRLLGFSARTAHRRVRELVTRLGVETRFQAGVQAAKLGWL